MTLARRGLFGLGAALAAPLVVPYSRIMPVKAWVPPAPPVVIPATFNLNTHEWTLFVGGRELRVTAMDAIGLDIDILLERA